VGKRLAVPYEAPQGRRVNAIGAYFSHGPQAGRFPFLTYASLPKSRAKQPRKTVAARAVACGLTPAEVGVIDSEVFLAFVWTIAGRPPNAPADWRRERPLIVVLDNYQVHKSERVRAELAALTAADIYFFYLPTYSPELSRIEPVWQDVKYRRLPRRSHDQLGDAKRAVEVALAEKARSLQKTTKSLTGTA
jgi:hypothetical protein